MKKVFFAIAFSLFFNVLSAQDLIRLTNGTSFFATIQSIENGTVTYQEGVIKSTVPLAEVALVEFESDGVKYYDKSSLQTIDPKSIALPVYQQGNKVYVPFSSKDVVQRSGALKLRETIAKEGKWQVADCVEEAHFIMEFIYFEEGKDHGLVVIKDRNGNQISKTPKVKMSSGEGAEKGEEIASTLYNKYISEIGTKIEIENNHMLISKRNKGFVLRPELAVEPLFLNAFEGTVTLAYQNNPYVTVGVGTGFMGKSWTNFVTFRTYFADRKCSPFFDVRAGLNVKLQETGPTGFVFRGSFGLEFGRFNVSAGYGGCWKYYNKHHNRYNQTITFSIAYNIPISILMRKNK